ncbi:MAG: BON domain-containing protein [Actinomycetota bacterium]
MRKATVGDVMTGTVVVARETTPFKELARLMAEHGVRGLPVLADDDQLVGIVSEENLLASADGGHSHLEWLTDGKRGEAPGDVLALDLMTRDVVKIRADEPVDGAARVMLRNGVTRLPVVDVASKVIGIVTRTDLLRPFLREDAEIRKEIVEDVILDTMWIDPSTMDVSVERGVVTLKGTVETKTTKDVLVKLVHRVDGVVGVRDEVDFRADDRPTGPPGEMAGFGSGRGRLT